MAVINTNRYDFSNAVSRVITMYSKEATEALYEAVDEVTKESVRKLRAASREKFKGKKYAGGWTYQKDKGRLTHGAVIYNRYPGLPHLLENGHVTRNGSGRTDFEDTPAHPHIADVATWAENEVFDRVITKLERISR